MDSDSLYRCAALHFIAHSRDMQVTRVRKKKVSLTEVAAWAVVLLALLGALWEFARWLGDA